MSTVTEQAVQVPEAEIQLRRKKDEAEFKAAIELNRIDELMTLAPQFLPVFANGFDFSSNGQPSRPGEENHFDRAARLCFMQAEAFLREKQARIAATNAAVMLEKEARHA